MRGGRIGLLAAAGALALGAGGLGVEPLPRPSRLPQFLKRLYPKSRSLAGRRHDDARATARRLAQAERVAANRAARGGLSRRGRKVPA